jgi:hypothetical protein
VEQLGRISVLEAKERMEVEERYQRAVGFESLRVKLSAR